MALTLEAPSTESLQSHAAASGLRLAPNPEAETAVGLLDADATGDEQREGATTITVRLVKSVTDAVAGFEGHTGDVFDGYIDTDGNTWIPLATGDICLEAEEFEVVEPLASQEETVAVAAETIATVAETIPPAVETPTATPTPTAQIQMQPAPATSTWAAHDQRRRDYLREKDILQEQISALMIEQQKLKEQAKRCKKEAEVYIEQLNELIENWENPAPSAENTAATGTAGGCVPTGHDQAATDNTQPEPASQPGEPSQEEGQPAVTTVPSPPAVQSEAETARQYEAALHSVRLEALGIGGKLLEKLDEEHVCSIWDWEDLRKAVSIGRREWPKGVGEKKRDDIDARIGDWVAKNSHRWTPAGSVEAANDAVELQQDAERAADMAEGQPPMPEATATTPAVSSDIDDL